MRKSSAIFVSAIALGLAMFVPLKASAQGVSIYIDPGYPGHVAGYPAYYPPYPCYGYAYPSYGYGYGYGRPYYGTSGAKVDALRAAFIGDMHAGTEGTRSVP